VNARTSVEDIIGASKVRFDEELEQVFDQFTVTRKEILIQTCGGKLFSNTQFGERVYMKIETTIVLE
jgi:hypothetical protein